MRLAVLAFSSRGEALAQRLQEKLPHEVTWQRCPKGGLADWTAEAFGRAEGLVFVSSCGIALRAIAPHVCSKLSDPAVVVVDETGKFAVSLLSGHLGGANALTEEIAEAIGATPVITTATDVNGLFAVDVWANAQGLTIENPHAIKLVSGKLVNGETVRVRSDYPLAGRLPRGMVLTDGEADLEISCCPRGTGLHLIPRIVTLGIGCRRDTPAETIEAAVKALSISPAAVKQVCSIDLKAKEPGLLEFCRRHELPFETFSAEALAAVPGVFSPSRFVQSVTGVDNVCERSAVLGSGGSLLIPKTPLNGVTVAAAAEEYTVNMEG